MENQTQIFSKRKRTDQENENLNIVEKKQRIEDLSEIDLTNYLLENKKAIKSIESLKVYLRMHDLPLNTSAEEYNKEFSERLSSLIYVSKAFSQDFPNILAIEEMTRKLEILDKELDSFFSEMKNFPPIYNQQQLNEHNVLLYSSQEKWKEVKWLREQIKKVRNNLTCFRFEEDKNKKKEEHYTQSIEYEALKGIVNSDEKDKFSNLVRKIMPTDKPFKKNSPFRLSDSEIIEIIKSELGVISVQSVFEKINHFKLIDSNITNDSVINHNIEKLLQENDRLKNQSINIKSVLENTFNDNNYLETYSKSILIQSLKTNKEERKEIERKIMNMRRKLSYYQEIQGQKNEYIEVANFVPKKYSY